MPFYTFTNSVKSDIQTDEDKNNMFDVTFASSQLDVYQQLHIIGWKKIELLLVWWQHMMQDIFVFYS